jgi:flagellar motility protein MotE (MotC chaperone)
MPKSTKKKTGNSSKTQTEGQKGKGIVFTIITFFSVILIVAVVFGGSFFFIIHNNINGLGERYRNTLQTIPFVKLALPPVADPLDPKYLTAQEIKDKYVEFRKTNNEQKKQLMEYIKKLDELQKFKDEYDAKKAESDKALEDIKVKEAAIDGKQKQLDDMKKKIDELIASGDKAGLKQYFESVNPDIAKQVYAEVVKQQQVDENAKKFVQVYEAMDASAAAQIFEGLGNSKIDLVTQTLKNMKKDSAAAILSAMTPDFASKVTEKLDALYKSN